jgi:hypothetical protein
MGKTLTQQNATEVEHLNNKTSLNQHKQNQISPSNMDWDDWVSDTGDGNTLED